MSSIKNALKLLQDVRVDGLDNASLNAFTKAFDELRKASYDEAASPSKVSVEPGEYVASLTHGNILVVGVPDGWDDVKALVGRVLVFKGNRYAYTGWNSDRNEAYFKPSESIASSF